MQIMIISPTAALRSRSQSPLVLSEARTWRSGAGRIATGFPPAMSTSDPNAVDTHRYVATKQARPPRGAPR